MADTLLQITRQQSIESRYNRKHIDGYIRDALTNNPNTQEKIRMGVNCSRSGSLRTTTRARTCDWPSSMGWTWSIWCTSCL